jgi:hypothetical protein
MPIMKAIHTLAAVASVSLLGHTALRAAIVTQGDPQLGGIGYRWTVTMGASETASVTRHVGAWAWEDTALFSPGQTPVGWTHNSDWIALKLEAPAMVTITLKNMAGVPNPTSQDPGAIAPNNLYPGLTIWSGWDNNLAPQAFADANNEGVPTDNWHSYNNRGNIEWAEDLTYFNHLEPNAEHSITATLFMPAGDYTIVVGGKSISTASEPRQGYEASFAAVPAPEPTSAILALLGGATLLGRRHRRN